MKGLYNKTKALREAMEKKFQSMEDVYHSRTDEWQEGENGQEQYDKMCSLESYIGDLEQIEFEIEEMF